MTFNLEKRAEELFQPQTPPRGLYHYAMARQLAEKLAREALEAAAKECEWIVRRNAQARDPYTVGWRAGLTGAASIIRRIAQRPSRGRVRPAGVDGPDEDATEGEGRERRLTIKITREKCSSWKRYKAIRAPKCGCRCCAAKWRKARAKAVRGN